MTTDLSPLRSATWQTDAEAALKSLTSISSHSHDRAGCNAMAAALCELFQLPGLTVERHAAPGGAHGDHVVFFSDATALGGNSPPFTLLIGHLDTVFPAATFSGYRELFEDGKRLGHGPGVYDMKGGLVSIWLALRALAQTRGLGSIPLRGVIVSDEEIGSPSSQALLRSIGQGAKAALGFESGRSGDAIITQRKGLGALLVRATGKAAHAGNLHHEGRNAIWALARFIDAAQNLTDYDRGLTVNVGRIEGGTNRNVVPDRAEAWVDFRYIAEADGQLLGQTLHQAAQAAADSLPGTTLSVEGGITRLPLCRTPASAELLAAYGRCQIEAGLAYNEAPLLGGGSDASTVAPLGIPAIDGLGPRGRGFHTPEERVELDSILPKAEALARYLLLAP